MRYGQFVNTSKLIKDIEEYQNDRKDIMMRNISKKENKKFKEDILKCIKVIFSPSLFLDCQFIFVGEDKERLFEPNEYIQYTDFLVIIYSGIHYIAPVTILSNCITPKRFAKIMENIDDKNGIEMMDEEIYFMLNKFEIL